MADTSEPDTLPGPRELFIRMKQHCEQHRDRRGQRAGRRRRGRDPVRRARPAAAVPRTAQFQAFAQQARASLPVRFTDCRDVAIHDTADPEVIVVEYELTGIVVTTGLQASASFIGVLRARDGQVVAWREYQDTMAIAAVLGHLPS